MVDSRQAAPFVGIAACLLVIVVLATPYVLAESQTAGLYYESGVVNPLLAGLLAMLAAVVFAAGRQGRTDGALAAGVSLTLGLFIAMITVAWALTVQFGIVDVSLASIAGHSSLWRWESHWLVCGMHRRWGYSGTGMRKALKSQRGSFDWTRPGG